MNNNISFFLLVNFSFLHIAYSQNLIPNSGFEEDEKVKLYYLEKNSYKEKISRNDYLGLVYKAKYWKLIYDNCFELSECSGDFYKPQLPPYFSKKLNLIDTAQSIKIHNSVFRTKENKVLPYGGVPINAKGEQEAHSGIAYTGFFLNSLNISFLQIKLKDSLVTGKSYAIKIFASLAEDSMVILLDTVKIAEPVDMNKFGVYFSTEPIPFTEYKRFIKNKEPTVYLQSSPEVNNRKDWGVMSTTYKARSNAKYMVFGYFGKENRGMYNSHYYIDDVCVAPMINREYNCGDFVKLDTVSFASFSFATHQSFVLKNLTFKTGSAEIEKSSYENLDSLAGYLSKNKFKLEINGHTDNVGNEESNQQLSEQRAKSVASYLISKGIIQDRITYIGYGSSKPVSDNATEEGKQKNRRVEFMFK